MLFELFFDEIEERCLPFSPSPIDPDHDAFWIRPVGDNACDSLCEWTSLKLVFG